MHRTSPNHLTLEYFLMEMIYVFVFLRIAKWRNIFALLCIILGTNSVEAQTVTADFTPTSAICGSAVVTFTGSITSGTPPPNLIYSWNFGDGHVGTGITASNGFPVEPGTTHTQTWGSPELPFTVVLTVTNAVGGAIVATVSHDVIVRPSPPTPVLADVLSPRTPFNNCASATQSPLYSLTVGNQTQGTNTIASYEIDWGDGTTGYTSTNPLFQTTHIYTQYGLFTLKFTSIGLNGCKSYSYYTVKNQGIPNIGIIGGNTSGCARVTFSFNVNNTSGNDQATTYVWDFGDGSTRNWTTDSITATGGRVSHTYVTSSCTQPNSSSSYYTVKITATNACQSSSASYFPVRVGVKPIPSFNATNLCEGEAVVFHNTTNPGSNFDCSTGVFYRWDFGDGSQTTTLSTGDVTHTYTTGSTFNARLIAVNDCLDSVVSVQNIVLIRRPIAGASLTPLQGCAPTPLTVTATDASTGDITTRTWSVSPASGWTWGPGSSASSVNPVFIFNSKGNYVVTLSVGNTCATNTKTFNVFMNGPISASFSPIGNQCDAFTFDATRSSIFNVTTIPNEVVTAVWTVTPATGWGYLSPTTDHSLLPQIIFSGEGDYTISGTLTNGCDTKTLSQSFRFANSPKALATPTKTEVCIPDTLHFTNQSTGFGFSSLWSVSPSAGVSFVNSTTSTSTNPDFKFAQSGIYTVTLKVTNTCGPNTKTFTIKAKDKPTVTLQTLPDICENTGITFNSTYFSVATNNGGTLSYNWTVTPNSGFSYQNATSATSAAPSYNFTTAGTYTISVAVTNDCGTVTKTGTLNVRPAVQLITSISDVGGCAPKLITFTDASTGLQLTHLWTVQPNSGFTYATGNSTSASPSMLFNNAGTYTITHTLNGLCSSQTKTFSVSISSFPTINMSPIADQCTSPFNLIIDPTNFSINQNGKTLTNLQWTVTPMTGVTYIDGTNASSNYPHLTFTNTGQYTVAVATQNDCGPATASQIFWMPAHAVEQSTSTALTGCLPFKVNFTDQSQGDKLVHSWTVSPAMGWTMTPSSSSASPEINFSVVGIYTVTHTITNSCGTDSHTYTVKVKDVPSVTLGLRTNSCNNYTFIADSQNVKLIPNLNDNITYKWTITPYRAINFLNGTSDTSHYPIIAFADTGIFLVKVITFGDCGSHTTNEVIGITKGPEIMLKDSLSKQCLPSDLTFTGMVYGQNLIYNWTINPLSGASFVNGTTSASPLPQIRFTTPGNYAVSLNVSNNCSNDIKTWNYTIIDKPTILFGKIADTCDNFTFRAERYVVVQDNGNAVTSYNWAITPSTGFSFVDGTTATSPMPHILFSTANTYTITMTATNGCGPNAFSRSFTLDQFIQVEAGSDTTLCTNNNLFQLNGIPAGGSWTIAPSSAASVLRLIGATYYLDLNVPGNYSLTYSRGNSYCASTDIRRFNILALPVVDAGRDFTLCANDRSPHTLTGTPAGGSWSGSGITGNIFSTNGLSDGSYLLKYTWTDPVTNCTNTDQLVARLINVPATGFTAAAQGCKDLPVLYTPNGVAGTLYNWNFGDGQTAVSSASINHTFRSGGTFTVSMVSADPNSCSLSTSFKIFIQSEVTLPVVTVSPNRGCGPLSVTFTIDTTGNGLNGQKYSWNFGNGQTTSTPFTTKTLIYNQAIADTTYTATLKVSNDCFSNTATYLIMVNAKPHANFELPHTWECTPKTITIKNRSIDRNASFHWDFGDGTTSTDYEPTHTFSTGKIAKTYMIKLVAQNQCGKDSITKPLLIKPNSIEAFIQMKVKQACPGDPVVFTNFSTDTVLTIMNYYWDFGDGTIANTWNATHAYVNPGKYTIRLFVDNGCSYSQASDTINISPSLTVMIKCKDSVCVGENFSLQGTSPLGALINTTWNFGDNSSATGTLTNHTFTTAGWHTVTFSAFSAVFMTHCPGSVTKRIYVKALSLVVPVQDIEGCSPVRLSLIRAGSEPQLWNFGEDSLWTSSGNYTFVNNNTNNQPIRRRVSTYTESTLGCRSYSYFWVTIDPSPKAKIRLNSQGGSPEMVFVSSLSTNTNACKWTFPDGTTSEGCDSVLIKLYNNGFYKISLRSSNQYGCQDTSSVVHETIIKGLFVPNAFQPSNADSKVNRFKPVGIGLKSYYLGIFDTWDNPIWETTKLEETQPVDGWDGLAKNGKRLPMDVYIWRIKAVFVDGTDWKGMKGRDGVLRTEGTVTLVR